MSFPTTIFHRLKLSCCTFEPCLERPERLGLCTENVTSKFYVWNKLNGQLFKNAMQKCTGVWESSFFCAGNSFKEGNVLKRQHCMLIWENVGTKLF